MTTRQTLQISRPRGLAEATQERGAVAWEVDVPLCTNLAPDGDHAVHESSGQRSPGRLLDGYPLVCDCSTFTKEGRLDRAARLARRLKGLAWEQRALAGGERAPNLVDQGWPELPELAAGGLGEKSGPLGGLGFARAGLPDALPGARQRQSTMNVIAHPEHKHSATTDNVNTCTMMF